MIFEITQEEIAAGGHECFDCPLSRVIRKNTGNKMWFATTLGLKKKRGGKIYYKWPTEVYQWIVKYDNHQKVQPFRLEIPDSILGLRSHCVQTKLSEDGKTMQIINSWE